MKKWAIIRHNLLDDTYEEYDTYDTLEEAEHVLGLMSEAGLQTGDDNGEYVDDTYDSLYEDEPDPGDPPGCEDVTYFISAIDEENE